MLFLSLLWGLEKPFTQTPSCGHLVLTNSCIRNATKLCEKSPASHKDPKPPNPQIPSRHLQECSGSRAGKCPAECFLSDFGHLARSALESAFWVLFGTFRARKTLKSTQKALFRALRARCQNHSKSTPGGTFQPGPLSTPVDGGWDRKPNPQNSSNKLKNLSRPTICHENITQLIWKTSNRVTVKKFNKDRGPKRVMSHNSHKCNRYPAIF